MRISVSSTLRDQDLGVLLLFDGHTVYRVKVCLSQPFGVLWSVLACDITTISFPHFPRLYALSMGLKAVVLGLSEPFTLKSPQALKLFYLGVPVGGLLMVPWVLPPLGTHFLFFTVIYIWV